MLQVCDGPACRLRAADLGGAGVDGAPVGCLGRCDAPVAAFDARAGRPLVLARRGAVAPGVPAAAPRGRRPPLLLRDVELPQQAALAAAGRRGAYRALASVEPGDVGELVRAVTGLGPAAELRVCCGGRAPGAFAARPLCERDPHLVIEGAALAARALGAAAVRFGVPEAWPEARRALDAALREAAAAGHLGAVAGSVGDGDAGGAVTVEQAALVARAVAALGAADGDAWSGAHPPPRLHAVSGDVFRPGVYELPRHARVAALVDAAGGVVDGVRRAALGAYLADGALGTDPAREAPAALVVFHAGRDARSFV